SSSAVSRPSPEPEPETRQTSPSSRPSLNMREATSGIGHHPRGGQASLKVTFFPRGRTFFGFAPRPVTFFPFPLTFPSLQPAFFSFFLAVPRLFPFSFGTVQAA